MTKAPTKADLARLAVDVRKTDLGLSEFEPMCPYRLAKIHGVNVWPLEDVAGFGCAEETIELFVNKRPEVWSAALVPFGDGQFIVENTAHSRLRRRSNVAHEMAHVLLDHEFDRILFTGDQRGCKNPASAKVEKEAIELSGELLLPKAAATRAAIAKLSDQEVADRYDVSLEFARWRMGVSGARLIAVRAALKRASGR